MIGKTIEFAEATSIPVPRELTPGEEAAVLAQYKIARTLEVLEADYCDFDEQVASGVSAEQLLKELPEETSGE